MTQQEKREQKLNKVLNEVTARLNKSKNDEWKKGWFDVLNMTSFLYGCGRMNDYQALVRLIFAGVACDMKQDDFMKLLDDKGGLFNE